MYGNEALPTKKYAYGTRENLPGVREKFPGYELAVDQLHKAQRLQNKLVALEIARRDRVNALAHALVPDLDALRLAAEELAVRYDELRDELAEAKARSRRRNPAPDLAARVRAVKEELAAARDRHVAARRVVYGNPEVAAAIAAVDAEAGAAGKAIRLAAVHQDGLYWATSLNVVNRVPRSGPRPEFKSWTGEGQISVQFQAKGKDKKAARIPVLKKNGAPRLTRAGVPMTKPVDSESLRGAQMWTPNTICYIEPRGPKPAYVWVNFRIGSGPKGKPIWARVPTVLHRPLPPDGQIKWVHMYRYRTGPDRYRWEVHFDVSMTHEAWARHHAATHPDRKRAATGTVGVALGWRKIGGAIRVAVWAGSDGRTGEVWVPEERVARWVHCDALQGVRDELMDRRRAALLEWMKTNTVPPEWVEKYRINTLAAWKSPNRLSRFTVMWRHNRIPGDAAIFAELEGALVPAPRDAAGKRAGRDHYTGGRKQDKHLGTWAAHQRLRCKRWRKWLYRDVALELSAEYARVATAEINWHAIAQNPDPEDVADPVVNKRYRGMAACASLRDELHACLEPVAVPAPGITVTCHACGAVCDPPGAGRWVTCRACPAGRMDRALNAARNLLQRAPGAPPAPPPA